MSFASGQRQHEERFEGHETGLGGYFVSFMSGNSTRLGVELATDPSTAGLALLLISAFVAGAAAGTRCRVIHHERGGFLVLAAVLIASALSHEPARRSVEFADDLRRLGHSRLGMPSN